MRPSMEPERRSAAAAESSPRPARRRYAASRDASAVRRRRQPLLWTARFLSAGLGVACAVPNSWTQEALRASLAGERAAEARKQAVESGDYNFKLGPGRFNLSASLGVEYNDNIGLSSGSESFFGGVGNQADFIFTPQLTVRGEWPLTPLNRLNASVSLGYRKYLEYNDLDQFTIGQDTDSELSFDVFVRDFRFNLHDRFSYRVQTGDTGAVSGVSNLATFENLLGCEITWHLNQLKLIAGIDHQDSIPSNSDYSYQGRASELAFLRTPLELDDATMVGLEFTGEINRYKEAVLNDSVAITAGLLAHRQLTPYVQIDARAGYALYEFQDTGVLANPGLVGRPYWDIGVQHRINEHLSATLGGGHRINLGFYSDYVESYFAQYSLSWQLLRGVSLNVRFTFEDGVEPAELVGERFTRLGGGLGLSYQFAERLSTSLQYDYMNKASDPAEFSYDQNRVNLTLTYRFGRR